MSAWDEAVRDALREACAEFVDTWRMGPTEASDMLLTTLAPHLAARDAAVRREALEEAARCVEGLCDPGTPASSVTTVRNHAAALIRALATDATP